MQVASEAGAPTSRLSWRVIVAVGLTSMSLLLLVVPGEMVMPGLDLTALLPGGCSRGQGILTFLALLIVGFALSLTFIVAGVIGIVLTVSRRRGGVTTLILVNAIVATVFLTPPLTFSAGDFLSWNDLVLGGFLDIAPGFLALGSAVLLLSTLRRLSRRFAATLIVSCLLLLPGAAGLTVFAIDVAAGGVHQTQNSPTGARC